MLVIGQSVSPRQESVSGRSDNSHISPSAARLTNPRILSPNRPSPHRTPRTSTMSLFRTGFRAAATAPRLVSKPLVQSRVAAFHTSQKLSILPVGPRAFPDTSKL